MDTNILPADFDGQFRFTNWTTEDFRAKWDGVEYTFPALKMTPMSILSATPLEIQNIRKKFARELAVNEFYKSKKFKGMDDKKHGQNPAIYTDSDLEPYIQRCLEPLETGRLIAKPVERKRIVLSEDTKVLDGNESLKGEGNVIA